MPLTGCNCGLLEVPRALQNEEGQVRSGSHQVVMYSCELEDMLLQGSFTKSFLQSHGSLTLK